MEAEIVVPEISQQKESEEKQVREDSDYEKFQDKISTELSSTTVQKPETKIENFPAKRSDATGLPTVAETAERMSSEKVEVATSESFTQAEIVVSTVVENKDKKHFEGDEFCETPSKQNVVTLVNGEDKDASEMTEVKVEETKEEKSHQSVLLSSQTSGVEAKKPKDQIGHEVEKFEISKDALPQIAQEENLSSSSVKETMVEKGFWTVAEHESLNWTTNLTDEEQNAGETEIMKEEEQKKTIKISSLSFKQNTLDPIRILQNIEQDEGFEKKHFEAVDTFRGIGEVDLEYENPKDVGISIQDATVESTSREEQKNYNEISSKPINPTEGKNYTSDNMVRKNSSTSETLIPVSREKCETEDDGTNITSQKLLCKLHEDTKSVADEMTEQVKSICETFDYVSHEGETEDTELGITSTDVLEEEKFETLKMSKIPTPEDEIRISIDNMDNERPKDTFYTENNERNLTDAEAEGRYLVQRTKFVEVKIENRVELNETKFVEEPREIVCPVPQECEPRTVDQKEKVLIERSAFQTISESIDEENSKTDGIDCEEVSHQPEPKDDKDSSQKSQNLPYIKEVASKFEHSEKTDQLHEEVQDTEDQALNMVNLHDKKLDQDLQCPEKEVPVIPLLVQASTEETTDKQEELNELLVLSSNKKDMETNPRQATATSEAEDAGEKQTQGQREGETYTSLPTKEGSLQIEEAGKEKFVKDMQDHAKQKETTFIEVPAETNSSQPDYEFRLTDTKVEELLAEQGNLETISQTIDEQSSKNDEISCEEISHEPVPQDTEESSEKALRSLEEKIGIEIENIERTSQFHEGVQNFDIEEEVPNVITLQDKKLNQDFKCPEREVKVISSDIQASTDKLKHEELNGLFVLNYNQKELGTTHSPIAVTLEAEDVGEEEMQGKAENEPYATLPTDMVSLQQEAGSMKFLEEKVEDNFEQKEKTFIEETAENNSSVAQEYVPRSTDMREELTEQDNLESRLYAINDESVKKDVITCEDISRQLLPQDIQERSEKASVLQSPEEKTEIEIKNSETTDEEVQNFDSVAEALNVISLHDKKLDQDFRCPEAEASVISSAIQASIGEIVDKSKKQEEPNEQFVSDANGKDLEAIPRPTTVTLEGEYLKEKEMQWKLKSGSYATQSTEEASLRQEEAETQKLIEDKIEDHVKRKGTAFIEEPEETNILLPQELVPEGIEERSEKASELHSPEEKSEIKIKNSETIRQTDEEVQNFDTEDKALNEISLHEKKLDHDFQSPERENAENSSMIQVSTEETVQKSKQELNEQFMLNNLDTIPRPTTVTLEAEDVGDKEMQGKLKTVSYATQSTEEASLSQEVAGTQKLVEDKIEDHIERKETIFIEEPEETNILLPHELVPEGIEERSEKASELHSPEEKSEIKIKNSETIGQKDEEVQNFDTEYEALNEISLHEKKLDHDFQSPEREAAEILSVIQVSTEKTVQKSKQELNEQFMLNTNGKDLDTIPIPTTVTLEAEDVGDKEMQGKLKTESYATQSTEEASLSQEVAGTQKLVEYKIEDHIERKETTFIEEPEETNILLPQEYEHGSTDMSDRELTKQRHLESSSDTINEESMKKNEISCEKISLQPVPEDTEETSGKELNLHSLEENFEITIQSFEKTRKLHEGVQNFDNEDEALDLISLHEKKLDQDVQYSEREVNVTSSVIQASTEKTIDKLEQEELNGQFQLISNAKDLETISRPNTVTLDAQDMGEKEVQGNQEDASYATLPTDEMLLQQGASGNKRIVKVNIENHLEQKETTVIEKTAEIISSEPHEHEPRENDMTEKAINGQGNLESSWQAINEGSMEKVEIASEETSHQPVPQDTEENFKRALNLHSPGRELKIGTWNNGRIGQTDKGVQNFALSSTSLQGEEPKQDFQCPGREVAIISSTVQASTEETADSKQGESNEQFLLNSNEKDLETISTPTTVTLESEDVAEKEVQGIEETAEADSLVPQEYEPASTDVREEELTEQGVLESSSHAIHEECLKKKELLSYEGISHQPVPQDTEESSEKVLSLHPPKENFEIKNNKKTGQLHEEAQNFDNNEEALNVISSDFKKLNQDLQCSEREVSAISSTIQASTEAMVDKTRYEQLDEQFLLISNDKDLKTIPLPTIVTLEDEDVGQKETQGNQADPSYASLATQETQQEVAGSKTYVEGNIEDCLEQKETTFIEEAAEIISSVPQEYEPISCDVAIEQGSLQTNSQGNDKESKETNEIACEEISHQPVPQDTEGSEKSLHLYALEEKAEVETENSEKTGQLHEATKNFDAESEALNVIHLHNKKQDQGFQYPEGETALVSSASQASTQEMVDEAKYKELNGECALASNQKNLETIPRSTIVNLEGEDVREKEVQGNQEDASHATLPIEEAPLHQEEAENQKGDNVTTVAPGENTQPSMTGTGFTCSARSVENEDLHEVEKDDDSPIPQAPFISILHKDGRSCQMDEETDGPEGDGLINYDDGAHIKNHDGNTTQEAIIARETLEISIKNQGIEGFKEEKEQKVDFDKQNLEAKSPSEESMEKSYDVFSPTQERRESLEKEERKKQDNIEEIKSLNIKSIDTEVYLGCDNGGAFDDSKHLDGHAQETIYPGTNDYVTQEERKDTKNFHIPIAESQPQINIDLARAEESVGRSESASEEMNDINTKGTEVKDEMEESKQDIGLDSSSTTSCQVEAILTKNHQKSEEASGSSFEEHTENKSDKFEQGKELLSYSEEVREHEVTLDNDEQEINREMETQKQKDPSTGVMQKESSEHLVKNEGTVACLPFSIQDSVIETSQEPIKKLVQDPNVEIQEYTQESIDSHQDTPEMEFKKKEDLSENALETENSEKPDENEMDNVPSNIHESSVEVLQDHADRLKDCSTIKLEKDIIEETTTGEDSSIMEVVKKEEAVVKAIQEESKKNHTERETITHISSATHDSKEDPSQGHADQLSESSKLEVQEEMIDNFPSVQHIPEMKANVQEDSTEVNKYINEDLLKNKAADVTTNNDVVGDISKEHIMNPEASSIAELQEGVPTETVHDFQLVDNKRQEDPCAQTLYKQGSKEVLKNRKCQDIPSADQYTTQEVLTEPAKVQEQSQLVLQKETQEQKTAAEYLPHEKDEKQKRRFENLVKKDIADASQISSFKYLEEIPEKKVLVQEISEAEILLQKENDEHDSSATQDSVGGVLQEYLDSQNECSKVELGQEEENLVQDTLQMGGKNQEDRFLKLKMEIYEGPEYDNHKHEVPQELLRSTVTEKGSTESERIEMDGEEQVKSPERDAREKTSLIIASRNTNIEPRNEGDYNFPASEFSPDTVVEMDETQPGIQEREVKIDSMRQNHEATDPCENEKQVLKEEPAHVNVQEESTVDVQTETNKQEGTGPKYQTETDKQEGTGLEMDSVEVIQQADVMPKEDSEFVPNDNQNTDGHDKLQYVAAEDEESKKLSETMETDTCEEPKEAEERQEIAPQFETGSEQNENENSRPDLSAHVELIETHDEITIEQAGILQTDEDFSERILIPKDSEDSATESVDIQQRKTEADIQSQVRDTEQATIQVIQHAEDMIPKEASDFLHRDNQSIDGNKKLEYVIMEDEENRKLSEMKETNKYEETKEAEERLEISPQFETDSEKNKNEDCKPDQSSHVKLIENHKKITIEEAEILKTNEQFLERTEDGKDNHNESASELVALQRRQIEADFPVKAKYVEEASIQVIQQDEDIMPKEASDFVPKDDRNIDCNVKREAVTAEYHEGKKMSETKERHAYEETKDAEERQQIAPGETLSEYKENEESRPDQSANVEPLEIHKQITIGTVEILETGEDFSEQIESGKDNHEESASELGSIQVTQQQEDVLPKEASDFFPKGNLTVDDSEKLEHVTAENDENKRLSETREQNVHEKTKEDEERLETVSRFETGSDINETEDSRPYQSAVVELKESPNNIAIENAETDAERSKTIERRNRNHMVSATELAELEEKQIQVNLQLEARDMQEVGLEQGQIEKELQSKEEVKEEEAGVEVMTREVSVDLEQAPCVLSMNQFLPIIDERRHETLKTDEIILPHEAADTEPESEILQQTKYFETAANLTEENKHSTSGAIEHTDGNNPNKEGDPDDYTNIKFETQDSTKEILKKELYDTPVGTSSQVLDEQISETNVICKNVESQGLPDNKTFRASAADSIARKVLQVETQKLQEVPTLVTELQHHETHKAYMNYDSPKEDLSQRKSSIMKETTDDDNNEEKAKDVTNLQTSSLAVGIKSETISEGEKATDDLFSSLEMSDSMDRSNLKDVGDEIPPKLIKTADENEKLSLEYQIPTDDKHMLQEAASVTDTHKDDEIREGKVHRGHELTYNETIEGITGSESSVKTNILEKEIELERHVARTNKERESGENQEEMERSEIAPNITDRPHVESIPQSDTAEKEIQTRDASTDMIIVRNMSTETQTSDLQKAPGEKSEMVEQRMEEERSASIENDSPDEKIASVQTDIEHGKKIEEEKDEEEQKHVEFAQNAPIIAEASKDADQKPAHKKHNILSSVGSKVKHSLGKVKKAITGKSSHDKSQPPQAKD